MTTLKETESHRSLQILVADDRLLVRQGMRLLLGENAQVETVHEASNPNEIKDVTQYSPIDVILLDHELLNRTDDTILDLCGDTPTIVLSVPATLDAIEGVIATGSCGFLLAKAKPEDLEDAIMLAGAGRSFLCPSIFRSILTEEWAQASESEHAVSSQGDPSVVYRDSVRLFREGMPLRRIARALNVSVGEAETAVARLVRLCGRVCRDTLQKAVSMGVLSSGSRGSAAPDG